MYNPDEECKELVDAIQKLCKQKNMTWYALAKKAGVSTSTISYLMNGKTKPQVYTVLALCNVLGVTISELFDDKSKREAIDACQPENGQVTYNEETLLQCYRRLSEKKKELLQIYVDMLQQYAGELIVEK